MPRAFDLAVWDFDGVLNANIVDGRFVWSDDLRQDLGIDPAAFEAYVFASGLIRRVIRGDLCLRETTAAWLAENARGVDVDRFLAYWFAKDARPDAEVTGWLRAHSGRKVIGTNNERLRSAYIEEEMGYGSLVERLFSSGRLGVAKPEVAFFKIIGEWAEVAPERILLIDDSKANIEAACDLGWQGFHFTTESRGQLPAVLGLGS